MINLNIGNKYINNTKNIYIKILSRYNGNNKNKYLDFELVKNGITKNFYKIKIKDFQEVLKHYDLKLLIEQKKDFQKNIKDRSIKKIRI